MRRRGMTGRRGTPLRAPLRRDGSIDAFEMGARGVEHAGTVKAADFARASDKLAAGVPDESDEGGTLEWRIVGITDALGRPAIEVRLDGGGTPQFPRCLRPFSWPVEQRTMLLLARDERDQASLDENDEHEVIVAAAPLDALELVEDELLLTLPFAPHCERSDCVTAGMQDEGDGEQKAAAAKSPFAALAALKTPPQGKPKARPPPAATDERTRIDRREPWLSSKTRNRRRSAACTARTIF